MFNWFVEKSENKEKIQELKDKNSALQQKVESLEQALSKTPHKKRIKQLEEILKKIPSGARGEGAIFVHQDDEYKFIKLRSKKELEKVVEDAKSGKLEIVFS